MTASATSLALRALPSFATALAAALGAVHHRHPASLDATLSDVHLEIVRAASNRHGAPSHHTHGAEVLLPIAGRVIRVAVSAVAGPSRLASASAAAVSTGAVAWAADRWLGAVSVVSPMPSDVGLNGAWR